ncbi:MAG: hypothetical protein U0325_00290 [Polyangiales bacterium]
MRALLLALSLLAGCGRFRRRAPRAREVDPRQANATACVDPRFFASSAVTLPSRGPVRDIAVAGGPGARRVAWRDDDGAHRWDCAAGHRLDPSITDLCAWISSPGVRCGHPVLARGGGRVAALRVARAGAADATLFVDVRAGGRRFEAQQLSARFADDRAAIVWDGGAFAAAWSEPVHAGNPRAYFAFIDREGRRVGSAMRVLTRDDVGLTRVALAFAGSDYLLAGLRGDGTAELRASGPRGCDEPLLPQPPAVPMARR